MERRHEGMAGLGANDSAAHDTLLIGERSSGVPCRWTASVAESIGAS